MGGLSISLMGPLSVTLDGQPVNRFEYNKVRALLAYLVVECESPHRREALAGLLWPDQSQKAALDSLRNALSKLRHAIGDKTANPPFLFITKDSLQFNLTSDHWLDVSRFTQLLEASKSHHHRRIEGCPTCTDRLIEAAALYRGEFLEGFYLPDSDLFEDWLRITREEYLPLVIETLRTLASTYEWRGEPDKALVYIQRQLKLDPCHEEAHSQAMKLLASQGMRAEACAQYEQCRELLANELGVEPLEATTRLYEQIKYGLFLPAPTLDRLRINNLPPNLTSFVGRERELAEINLLIEDPTCRLLTLVGPGGVGKTRLAIAAAGQQTETFPHGACFIPLAGISSIEAIIPVILKALGRLRVEQEDLNQQEEPKDLRQQLTDYLRDKEMLLVLDNFEQLVDAAGVVSEILQQAPGVVVLVTSRQRLGLQAEWLFEVNGLSYPSGKAMQDLAAYEAVQLFTARLHQVKPRTTLFQDDLPGVSHICQLVEGLPLGIELAASAVRRKSIEQVATAIESGKEDLAVSWKDVPERHRSLRAVFEHSYRLLTDDKQRVFCGLAVFRTGFTAEAAQQVAEATPEVLEALVEHSMLRYDPNTGYYDLHELVRQYGLDKLKAKGMESDLRQRHSTYYMQALERWGIQQEGAGQVVALIEMDHQLADVQTAWEWACQQQALAGLTKGWKGLCRYYAYRFRPVEGEHDLKAALDMLDGLAEHKPQSQRLKAQLLNYLSVFQIDSGRNDRSKLRQTLEKKSIDILEDLQQAGEDVRLDMAWIINDLANTITDSEQAIRLVQHGLDLARQVGSKRYQAMLLEHLAWIYFSSDDILKAEHCCQEALAICRLIGDPWRLADTLQTLSLIIITQGKIQSGLQAALESAQLYHTLSDRVIYNYGVNSLGLIFWFGRKWEEADKTYDENTPRLQDIGDRKLLCYDGSRWSIIKMFLGQYEAELAMAGRYLKLANQLDDLFSQALKNFVLGGVALAQGHADQAISSLEKAAALIKQTGNQSDWAMTVGTLSMALSWIGQLRQAQAQLIEALRTGTELHSYLSLSYAVPAAALLLVNTNQVERAVELCALIDEQAMCGKTPWFEDVAGREIKQLAASLPSSVVEAARERGRQRDLFLTAAELLEEFKNKQ